MRARQKSLAQLNEQGFYYLLRWITRGDTRASGDLKELAY